MAKKTATYSTYELHVEDNGKIVVLDAGQLVQNTMGAIRTIAAAVSFTLDPKWNTQSSGRKLIAYLNSLPSAATPTPASVSAPKVDTKPTPEAKPTSDSAPAVTPEHTAAPVTKPTSKPDNAKTDNDLTEEEMDELLKQIAELRKTIESLDSRIAKLEKAPAAATGGDSDKGTLSVVATHKANTLEGYKFNESGNLDFNIGIWSHWREPKYKKDLDERLNKYARWREDIQNGGFSGINNAYIWCAEITELSDGHFYTFSSVGSTLREVKAFATLIGYPIPDKAKTDVLAAAIVRERGGKGWCFADGQALKSTGAVYRYTRLSKQDIINKIKEVLEDSDSHSFIIEAPDMKGKTEKELVEAYIDMFNEAKPRELPSKDEILRQFDETLRIEKLKLKE